MGIHTAPVPAVELSGRSPSSHRPFAAFPAFLMKRIPESANQRAACLSWLFDALMGVIKHRGRGVTQGVIVMLNRRARRSSPLAEIRASNRSTRAYEDAYSWGMGAGLAHAQGAHLGSSLPLYYAFGEVALL